MNRKILYFIIIIGMISCFMLANCSGGGGKYGEVKDLLNQYISASERLTKSVDNAKNGKELAKALTEYVTVMKTLSPKVESLPDKYPELETDPPKELEELVKAFEESMEGITHVFEKAMEYADDPDVLKALEAFENMD